MTICTQMDFYEVNQDDGHLRSQGTSPAYPVCTAELPGMDERRRGSPSGGPAVRPVG